MACRVPFVFCCILSLFMQFGLLEQSRLNEENLALEQLIKENAKQYELSKKTVEIINMKCHDLSWISQDGSDVTEDFIHYASPLIQGNVELPMGEDGLPVCVYRK